MIKVLAGTSQIHAETFARALGAEVVLDVPEDTKWVFLVGVSPEHKSSVEKLRAKGIKVAAYWIGSDSFTALQNHEFRAQIPECDVHLAVHERIQDELASWKVASHVVYPCARNYYTKDQVPKRTVEGKVVGVYSPTPGPNDLYMHNECVLIAKENPDMKFIFYGAPKYEGLPENCIDAGRMSPEETTDLYSRFSCILRICHHDGFPVGGIEAKIRNIHIIENFPYPGFLTAKTLEDVNKWLSLESTHKEDAGPYPAWYRENCSPENFGKRVKEILGV